MLRGMVYTQNSRGRYTFTTVSWIYKLEMSEKDRKMYLHSIVDRPHCWEGCRRAPRSWQPSRQFVVVEGQSLKWRQSTVAPWRWQTPCESIVWHCQDPAGQHVPFSQFSSSRVPHQYPSLWKWFPSDFSSIQAQKVVTAHFRLASWLNKQWMCF